MGHEMTHGFDDQGRRFDAAGNLRDWWTPSDEKGFKQKSEALVAQYGQYIATGDTKVNGALTLGENISDLGGITVAYNAWKKTWKGGVMPAPIDGLKADQRFYLAFAQIWRFKGSPAYAALLAQVDAHSPARWRVLGTLANVPEFADAFGKSNAETGKVRIW